jgi:hypothetical protein
MNTCKNKTRYISVQVGIGGFTPASSNDVDQLGSGDIIKQNIENIFTLFKEIQTVKLLYKLLVHNTTIIIY